MRNGGASSVPARIQCLSPARRVANVTEAGSRPGTTAERRTSPATRSSEGDASTTRGTLASGSGFSARSTTAPRAGTVTRSAPAASDVGPGARPGQIVANAVPGEAVDTVTDRRPGPLLNATTYSTRAFTSIRL